MGMGKEMRVGYAYEACCEEESPKRAFVFPLYISRIVHGQTEDVMEGPVLRFDESYSIKHKLLYPGRVLGIKFKSYGGTENFKR